MPSPRSLTLSHVLQALLVLGLGLLIWRVEALRQAVVANRPESLAAGRSLPVVIQNARPLRVEVEDTELNVHVTNTEIDVNVTNPELDVNVGNTVSVMNY